jgi:hypothetical protein
VRQREKEREKIGGERDRGEREREREREKERKGKGKRGREREGETERFELCRRTQQPSLTFPLVGGSMFGLWPLFHLRDGGKWTEAWGNFKTLISSPHHYKN